VDEISCRRRFWQIPSEHRRQSSHIGCPLSRLHSKLLRETREIQISLIFPSPRMGEMSDATLSCGHEAYGTSPRWMKVEGLFGPGTKRACCGRTGSLHFRD